MTSLSSDRDSQRGRIRVAVLFGGQSDEHDVSLRSAQTVIGALDPAKFEVVPIGITRQGHWLSGGDPMRQLTAVSPLFAVGSGADGAATDTAQSDEARAPAIPPVLSGNVDVVFPVLHGPMGEDGTVQGLLELAGLPYVGAGVLGSAVAMDKAMTKTVLAQAGLPQAPWLTVLRRDWERDPNTATATIAAEIGYPCFTKPANMGSSVGITKVHDAGELAMGMAAAGRFDRKIIVEQGVEARELEVSVLGNDDPIASVAGEIVPCHEFYDYDAKYIDDRSELIIPAAVASEIQDRVRQLAIAVFRALDLNGMARVDFFLERGSGNLLINEVNTIPGFTSISMYPMLWEASGLALPELVERLIGLAVERHGDRHRRSPAD